MERIYYNANKYVINECIEVWTVAYMACKIGK